MCLLLFNLQLQAGPAAVSGGVVEVDQREECLEMKVVLSKYRVSGGNNESKLVQDSTAEQRDASVTRHSWYYYP